MKGKILLLVFIIFLYSCSSYEKKIKDKRLERDKDKVVSIMEEIFNNDQKPRKHIREVQKSDIENKKAIIDSLWQRQKIVDSTNTEILLKLTKRYGFPNVKRTQTKIPAFIIFHHSLRYHNKEVNKIIDRECKRGRLPEGEHGFIKWHLNGRKFKSDETK